MTAISRRDKEAAVDILAMYAEADEFDDPRASHELAGKLAFIAADLLQRTPDRDEWLAAARRRCLEPPS